MQCNGYTPVQGLLLQDRGQGIALLTVIDLGPSPLLSAILPAYGKAPYYLVRE